MCEHFLLPNSEFGYQLHVSAALNIGPGARAQVLHREEDSFTYFAEPRPNIILATMWAISDFRSDNGATLVVPGSHTWPADRGPSQMKSPVQKCPQDRCSSGFAVPCTEAVPIPRRTGATASFLPTLWAGSGRKKTSISMFQNTFWTGSRQSKNASQDSTCIVLWVFMIRA